MVNIEWEWYGWKENASSAVCNLSVERKTEIKASKVGWIDHNMMNKT